VCTFSPVDQRLLYKGVSLKYASEFQMIDVFVCLISVVGATFVTNTILSGPLFTSCDLGRTHPAGLG
jgi:hypothetical protein